MTWRARSGSLHANEVTVRDAIEAWAASAPPALAGRGGAATIDTWLVAGASKRGWTTWTTAAVAPDRVAFAVPVVLDVNNLVANMHHQWRAFGGWTFAFEDYYALNFTANLDDPNTQAMMDIVDPCVCVVERRCRPFTPPKRRRRVCTPPHLGGVRCSYPIHGVTTATCARRPVC